MCKIGLPLGLGRLLFASVLLRKAPKEHHSLAQRVSAGYASEDEASPVGATLSKHVT